MKAQQIVNQLLETKDFIGKPITGCHTRDGHPCVFYPYAGPVRSPQNSLLGFIKTRRGNIHGRLLISGAHFFFEPGDFPTQPDYNWHKSLLPRR